MDKIKENKEITEKFAFVLNAKSNQYEYKMESNLHHHLGTT